MDILEILHQKRSKTRNLQLIQFIDAEQAKFDELLAYFPKVEVAVQDSIAWVMSDCVKNNPHFLDTHYPFVIQNLRNPATVGIERNMYRALQYVSIPEAYQGEIADFALKTLSAERSNIANKVFAMTVLFELSQIYPELQHELALSIENQLPYGSAGFKNRGNKILNAIRKSKKV